MTKNQIRQPRIYEVYLYEGVPYIVAKTGKTFFHDHRYIDLVGAHLFPEKREIRLLKEDWPLLTPVLTRDGDFVYHSFKFIQHKIPTKELNYD